MAKKKTTAKKPSSKPAESGVVTFDLASDSMSTNTKNESENHQKLVDCRHGRCHRLAA